MLEDDEYEPKHCRIQQISPSLRAKHLQGVSARYVPPSRTDSFPSLNIFFDDVKAPPRAMSSQHFEQFMDDGPSPQNESIGEYNYSYIEAKLLALNKDPPPTLIPAIKNIISGKNQILTDNFTNAHFALISSIIQSHPGRHALIVTPSDKYSKWARLHLIDSTIELNQNDTIAINRISRNQAQVAIANFYVLPTTQLSYFDFILVLRSELIESSLICLSSFKGPIVFHQTPGYKIRIPFTTVENSIPLQLRCKPTVFLDNNYEHLPESLHSADTAIIFSFTNDLDEHFPKIRYMASKFNPKYNIRGDQSKAICGTTSILFNCPEASFNHYIFVGCPHSLSDIISACYTADSVTIVANLNAMLRLQSFAHNNGADHYTIKEFLQPLVCRKSGSILALENNGIDLTKEAIDDIISSLIQRGIVETMPYVNSGLNMQVLNEVEGMSESSVIHEIWVTGSGSKYSVKGTKRTDGRAPVGTYKVNIVEICNKLQMTPMQVESELKKYSEKKGINYWSDREKKNPEQILLVKREITLKDFESLCLEMEKELHELETERSREYDAIFSLIQNPDLIEQIAIERTQCQQIIDLPHAEVEEKRVVEMLKSMREVDWSPRGVARVMIGVGSPGFSYMEWSRSPYWGKQPHANFTDLMSTFTKAVRASLK